MIKGKTKLHWNLIDNREYNKISIINHNSIIELINDLNDAFDKYEWMNYEISYFFRR